MSAKCAVSQHQLKEDVLQLNQNQDKPKPAHYGVRLQPRPCWTVQDVSHNHRHNLLISISNQYDHYLQIDMCSVEDQKRVTGSINTCLLMS